MTIKTDNYRIIISDFAKLISERKSKDSAPKTGVINFRDDLKNAKERPIYEVPLELLRYRKDNGRIASDVLSYERTAMHDLDERLQETQDLLFKWLKAKDEKNTEILMKDIIKNGQTEPSIITCDGFLINGNRRKMVLQLLNEKDPTKYKTMKVIILPNVGEDGGQPTIKEIELLENRYQLMKSGKSEYEGLDRALSIRRKIEIGISLEEQLLDDPQYAEYNAGDKKFKEIVNSYRKEFLWPLEKVDEYLEVLNRSGHYASVEGKWQSFIDYSNFFHGQLQDQVYLAKNEISDNDIGKIQDACFKIIRKGSINGIKHKNHEIIREMKKFLAAPEAKQHILNIATTVKDLKPEEVEGKDIHDVDKLWGQHPEHSQKLSYSLSNAYAHLDEHKAAETPLSLLKDSYKRLTSEKMILDSMKPDDLKEFRKIVEDLELVAYDLKNKSLALINRKDKAHKK